MGLKFLNKKGWHTGSLRNIENVWKAEQKHDAEEKKLEELRKQIQEERERSEFRLLQEQAGLVPRQERLDFLYDSGLAVGKGSSDGFKALEALPKTDNEAAACTSPKQEPVPGALFEEKRQSANDAWRKLHSDPLLMIRQREQEALARVKNNPIQMAMIRKSVEVQKHKKASDEKEPQKNVHQRMSRHQKHSSSKHRSKSELLSSEWEDRWKPHKNSDKHKGQVDESSDGRNRTKKSHFEYSEHPPSGSTDIKTGKYETKHMSGKHERSKREKCPMEDWASPDATREEESRSSRGAGLVPRHQPQRKHQNNAPRLSEEERATRLREMLVDAELHEEQRWKRLRQAEEDDAREAMQVYSSGSRNSLEAAHKSLYGADRGGSSTIEKSVRRRAHYLQGKSDVGEGNAFRR